MKNKRYFKTKMVAKRTVQKLTDDHKIQRVVIAKRVRKKYGIKKEGKLYECNHVLNTNFSGTLTLIPL